MYDSGRYFTFTGDHIEGNPTKVEERQAEIKFLHAEIFGKPSEDSKQNSSSSKKASSSKSGELTDDELIERILKSKNGNKFRELWRHKQATGNSGNLLLVRYRE